jgi:hypothetical protein
MNDAETTIYPYEEEGGGRGRTRRGEGGDGRRRRRRKEEEEEGEEKRRGRGRGGEKEEEEEEERKWRKRKKENNNTSLRPFTKINTKWLIALNIKTKIAQLLKGNIAENLGSLRFGNSFLDTTPKMSSMLEKN